MTTAVAYNPVEIAPERLAKGIGSGRYRIDADCVVEKRCSRCKEYWPADSEFFFTGKAYPDGLHTYCKACYWENRWPGGRYPDAKRNLVRSAHERR